MNRPLLVTPLLLLLAAAANAQTTQATPPGPPPSTIPVAPPAPPPTSAPNMPTAPVPPPPEQENAPPVAATEASSQGQWAYTDQYGWIWTPYAESYVYVPASGAVPQMYVYSPSVGWTWVVAPWVWGLGPQPYLVAGPARYAWWGRGFGHWHAFNGEYAQWPARGYYHGGRWYGHRDVYTVPHGRDGAWVGHGKH